MIGRLVGQESGRQSAERVRAERFLAEQAQAEQARAEQASAEQARAEQARAAQVRDEQARREQARAEQFVAQQLATAEAAAKSSDFMTAYSIWTPLAQQGNAVAQNHLGIMYYYGEGVQQDYTKAFEWQMKAAEQGNAAGMLDVGAAYSNGQGVAENDQVGHQWYLKAANKGNSQAQYNVGLNYKDGVGTPADVNEAKRYFLLAAQQDHYRAQLEVAEMGASNSPPDRTAAIFWGATAAINNLAEAQLFMGDLFLTGRLVLKDHQAAAMWFTLASGYTGENIRYDNGEVGKTSSARLDEIKQVIGAGGLEKAKAAVKICNNATSFIAAIGPCGLGGLILRNPDGTFSVSPEVKTDVVVPAAASSPFESNLIEQLACQKRPNPTPILTYLMRNKYIRLEEMDGYDSVSCWKVVKPLSVRGLPVVGVCAYEEDDLVVSQNPGYYWRGPGTSPGVQITLVTSANADAASTWSKKTTEQIKVAPEIEKSSFFDGMTEVSCNESSRIWAEMQSRKAR
jgi:TPR repeat protein